MREKGSDVNFGGDLGMVDKQKILLKAGLGTGAEIIDNRKEIIHDKD